MLQRGILHPWHGCNVKGKDEEKRKEGKKERGNEKLPASDTWESSNTQLCLEPSCFHSHSLFVLSQRED